MIKNPDYKGPWVHPKVPNPDYKEDLTLYKYNSGAIFFDLWQVKSGTIFDDIIITDSIEEANEFAKETFLKKKDAELKAKEAVDEKEKEKRMQEEKEMEEKMKAKKSEDSESKEEESEEAKSPNSDDDENDETEEDDQGHDEL